MYFYVIFICELVIVNDYRLGLFLVGNEFKKKYKWKGVYFGFLNWVLFVFCFVVLSYLRILSYVIF